MVEYSDEFIAIEPELSKRETEFVMDVLDVFDRLEWSYGKLPKSERDELGTDAQWRIRFAGFSLNDRLEGRLWQYARRLIEQDTGNGLPCTSTTSPSGATHTCRPTPRTSACSGCSGRSGNEGCATG